MIVTRLELRDFRNYEAAELQLPAGLAVVVGPNGAGKTNLLEAVYFGCTGGSPRTSNERELVRRGASVARVSSTPETRRRPIASRLASSRARRSGCAWTGRLSTACRRWTLARW